MAKFISYEEATSATPPADGLISYEEATGATPENQTGGFMPAAKQAIGAGIKGLGQAATDFIPGVEKGNALSSYGQSVIDANPTAIRSFGDIADKPWTAVKEATGNALSSIGSMAGTRAAGMAMTAAAPFTGPFAPAVAGAGQLVANVGPFVAAALPSYGGIRGEQIAADPLNEQDGRSKAIALLGAGTVGAIEGSFGPQAWALAAMKKGGFEAVAKSFAAAKSLPGFIGKGALKGAAVEGAEELVQNPVEQIASYQDPTTGENIADTALSGAMGAIGGGVLGGGMAGVSYGSRERQPPEATPQQPAPQPVAPPSGPMGKAAATAQQSGAADAAAMQQAMQDQAAFDEQQAKQKGATNEQKAAQGPIAEAGQSISGAPTGLAGAGQDVSAASDTAISAASDTAVQQGQVERGVAPSQTIGQPPIVQPQAEAQAAAPIQQGEITPDGTQAQEAEQATQGRPAQPATAANAAGLAFTTPEQPTTNAGPLPQQSVAMPVKDALSGERISGAKDAPTNKQSLSVAPTTSEGFRQTPIEAPQLREAPNTAPAIAEPAIDVSTRTDKQLAYLSTNGKPGYKEAAIAEIARRGGEVAESAPDAAGDDREGGNQAPLWKRTVLDAVGPQIKRPLDPRKLPRLEKIAKERPESLTDRDRAALEEMKRAKSARSKYLKDHKAFVERSNAHYFAVQDAKARGEEIPPAVRADYPHLFAAEEQAAGDGNQSAADSKPTQTPATAGDSVSLPPGQGKETGGSLPRDVVSAPSVGSYVKARNGDVGTVSKVYANGEVDVNNGVDTLFDHSPSEIEPSTKEEYENNIRKRIKEHKSAATNLRNEAANYNKETDGRAVSRKGRVPLIKNEKGGYDYGGLSENLVSAHHRSLLVQARKLNEKADKLQSLLPKADKAKQKLSLRIQTVKTKAIDGSSGNGMEVSNLPQDILDHFGWKTIWFMPAPTQRMYGQKGRFNDAANDEFLLDGDVSKDLIPYLKKRLDEQNDAPEAKPKPTLEERKAAALERRKAKEAATKADTKSIAIPDTQELVRRLGVYEKTFSDLVDVKYANLNDPESFAHKDALFLSGLTGSGLLRARVAAGKFATEKPGIVLERNDKTKPTKAAEARTIAARAPEVASLADRLKAAAATAVGSRKAALEERLVRLEAAKAREPSGKLNLRIYGYSSQPESFGWAAKEVGGEVVYSRGDIALVEGFSPFGNAVYAGVKGDSRTRADISAYTGKLFSETEKAELEKAKADHVKEQGSLHEKAPDGPFSNGARFAKADGVSDEMAGVAQKWLSMLGIKSRVFLATKADVSSVAAIDKYNLRGPFSAIRSAGTQNEADGGKRTLPNGDHYIILPKSARKSQALEALAHEIGHVLETDEWKGADRATKDAVMADYQRWLDTAGNTKAADWVKQLRAHTSGKLTRVATSETADRLPPYWRSFGEYFADQVSRWATTSDKPLTAVDTFFKRIALAMRRLYAMAAGKPYLPGTAMKAYLDARGESSPLSISGKPSAEAAPAEAKAPEAKVGEADTATINDFGETSEVVKQNKQNGQAAKLRAAGKKIIADADDASGRDRLTNTPKRAREASYAEATAAQNKVIGETMLRIADAIEDGSAKALAGITARIQVEQLDSIMRAAIYASDSKEGGYEQTQRNQGRPFADGDLPAIKMPGSASWISGAKSSLIEAIAGKRGAPALRAEILRADGYTQAIHDKVRNLLSESDIKNAVGWHAPEMVARGARLARAGITNISQLRSAISEYAKIRAAKTETNRAKVLERALIGQKVGIDFFPTPKSVAQDMVRKADIQPGMKVLEPSAGNGNIAEAIEAAGVAPDVVEMSASLREILDAKGFNLVGQDFMQAGGKYDRIVMNPPFSNRLDAEHVQHAYTLLNPGGKIVAIMGEGVFFGSDTKAKQFREWLDSVGGTSEKLPEGTFTDRTLMATTGVNSRMVEIEKPAQKGVGNQSAQATITPSDSAIYDMAREGKSAQEILAFIGASARRPFERYLANALMNLGVKSTIKLDMFSGWKISQALPGKRYAAAYSPKTDTVAIFTPRGATQSVLHELVHAATLKALANPRSRAAIEMRRLFKHVQDNGQADGMYGMRNVDEFVAEAFSNPKFQQALMSIPAPSGSSLKSAWEWFVGVVARMLGMRRPAQATALDRAMVLGAAVMNENAAIAGNAAGGNRYAIAHHGTPHVFAPEPGFPHGRFRLDKMGTGEGAQAYGWGVYFAENKDVAGMYANQLRNPVELDGKKPDMMLMRFSESSIVNFFQNRIAAKIGEASARQQTSEWAKQQGQINSDMTDAAIDSFVSRLNEGNSHILKLDIPDDVMPKLLDWDKPLSEQPKAVRNALSGKSIKNRSVQDLLAMNPTGKEIVAALGKEDGASEYLASIGIPGLRYLDGDSRNRPLKEIKREFLNELPEDAEFSEVEDLIGTGKFSPKNDALLKALKADDWLGFDYPAQAVSAALGSHLGNFDASKELLQAVESAKEGGTHNYVIWDQKTLDRIALLERNGQALDDIRFREADDENVSGNVSGNISDTITIDGVERPRMNSNGKPIAQTDEALRKFYAWFGDSKVVDEQGRPLVVYHGASADFGEGGAPVAFDFNRTPDEDLSSGKGAYLTTSQDAASKYSNGISWGNGGKASGPNVMPVYARIEAPFSKTATYRIEDFESVLPERIIEAAKENAKPGDSFLEDAQQAIDDLQSRLDALQAGYLNDEVAYDYRIDEGDYENEDDYQAAIEEAIEREVGDVERSIERYEGETERAWADAKAEYSSARLSGSEIWDAIKEDLPEYADWKNERQLFGGDSASIEMDTEVARILFDAFGFDGVKRTDKFPIKTQHTVYIANNAPAQIKSAISNDEFSPDNPDIRFREADEDANKGESYKSGSVSTYSLPKSLAKSLHAASPNASAFVAKSGDAILLSELVIPKEERGGGSGSAFMAELTRYADENGMNIVLTADGDYGGSKIGQQRFYRRHGFVPNAGRNKDFRYRENMIRRPADAIRYNVVDDGQWQSTEPGLLDDVIYKLQHKQIDTRRTVQAITKAIGDIADKYNPELKESLYHGRAANETRKFLDFELRPLTRRMIALGVDTPTLEAFLWARHAEERNAHIAKINPRMPDGGSGLTNAQAKQLLAGNDVTINGETIAGVPQSKLDELGELSAMADAMLDKSRELLVENGLETRATIDVWKSDYPHYVPLHREEFEDDRMTGRGLGMSVKGPSGKRAIGSDKPVGNILAAIVSQRELYITRAEKNRVGNALYGLATTAPNEDFWKAVDPEANANRDAEALWAQIKQRMTKLASMPNGDPDLEAIIDGMKAQHKAMMKKAIPGMKKVVDSLVSLGLPAEMAERVLAEPKELAINPRTGMVVERVNPLLRHLDNVVATRINGRDVFVVFDARDKRASRMAIAMKNLDADQLGFLLGNMAKATRYFAAINTQFNPIFGVTNFVRDIQTAMLNLSSTPLADHKKEVATRSLSAMRGIYSDLRAHRAGNLPSSKWAAMFERFKQAGGATGYRDMFETLSDRSKDLQDELKKMSMSKGRRLFTLGQSNPVFAWLSDYNEMMENSVRVAAFSVGIEQGLSDDKAASLAKELTVNFNKKGQVAAQAGAMYAFFNAAVQGSARIAQTLFVNRDGKVSLSSAGKKIVSGGIMLGVAQAFLGALAGWDDEEPPQFVRERSLIIPLGDHYFSVPMPLGFNVLPNIGRITAEFAMSGFKDPAKRIGSLLNVLADTLNPIGNAGVSLQTIAPTVIDPLAALAENKDWTGKPIKRMSFNEEAAGYKNAKDTATVWSKWIAEGLNYLSGGTEHKAGLSSPTPDQIDYLIGQVTGGVGREISKAVQSSTSVFSGEDLPLYKVPLVGKFVGDTKGNAADASRFYANVRELKAHKAELDGRRKAGQDVAEYLRDNPDARLVVLASRIERRVQELRRAKRELVDQGAPKDRVKQAEDQIAALMKALNSRVQANQRAA